MTKFFSFTRQSLAVLSILALACGVASAEFRVVDTDDAATSRRAAAPWSMAVEFQANPQRARSAPLPELPYTMLVVDEITGEERVVEGQRPERDPLAERTVILTPTLLTAEELTARVEVLDWLDGSVAQGADASAAVIVRPFGAGTALRGIEIIARPGMVRDADGETRTAGRIRIELEGPEHAAGRVEISPRALQDPLVQRIMATQVLNTDAVRTGRSVQMMNVTPPALPQPPGDYRLTYKGGNEIFLITPQDIGITWGARGSLVLNHHGDSLPWRAMPGERMMFYAPRRVTDTDNSDSVFTRLDLANPSPAMRTRQAFTTMAPPATPGEATERGIQRTQFRRIANFHRQSLPSLPIGKRFVSPRVSRTTDNTLQTSIPVWDIPTNAFVQLRVVTHGDSTIATYTPDHVAGVSVNGSPMTYIDWNGFTRVTRTVQWLSALPTGAPLASVPVTYQVPLTAPPGYAAFPPNADWQHVESLEITYLGKPRVNPDTKSVTLQVVAGDQGRISVGGFPANTLAADIVVLDVTNPKDPELLLDPVVFPDETGGTAVHFQAPVAGRTYRVQYLGTTGKPEVVTPAESLPDTSTLAAPLRALYVRDANLAGALAPLVARRGAGVVEFSPQAAYNAFNGGQQSMEALRQALKLMIDRAPDKISFPAVMLVGHMFFDLRNISGLQVHPQIPGQVVEATPVPDASGPGGLRDGENMVDYRYSTLYGDDDYPDVRLGRVPVRGPGDVTRFVSRLLQYEANFAGAPGLSRPLVLAAGAGQPNEPFNRFIDIHRNFVLPIWNQTPFSSTVLDYDGGGVGTNNFLALRDAMQADQGAALVLYLGHGNVNIWQGAESFLRSGNLASVLHLARIDTRNKWPIAVNFTCASGRLMIVGRDEIGQYSIAESMLHYTNPDFGVPGGTLSSERRDDRGSVAAIMPVGFEFVEPMVFLEMEFMKHLAGENNEGPHRPLVIGREWLGSSIAYIDNVVTEVAEYQKALEEFILFGDPDTLTTLVSPVAEYGVSGQSVPAAATPGEEITLRLVVRADESGDEARGLVAELVLPPLVDVLEMRPTAGSVDYDGDKVLWTIGSLLPGVEAVLEVEAWIFPIVELPLEATVSVTAITQDVDTGNNSATIVIGPVPTVMDSLGIY